MKKASAAKYGTKLFVVSAPSGCGKTTLCNKLLGDGLGLANSISITTRKPRPFENSNSDYRFVTRGRFLGMAKRGEFLEYEENFGNLYGTPKKFVEKNLAGRVPVLLSIDVKGAMKVRRAYPKDSVLIFILPPSIRTLKTRLHLRKSDGPEEVKRRLALAKKEIAYKDRYDYRIVNDRLDDAYRTLKKIVLKELETTDAE
ncbi:MAG: guanylate kinase [Candidatus Omnitrophica bacterium]|nr:guanylate kinase [Candidatus Omnitrophota bacterium]